MPVALILLAFLTPLRDERTIEERLVGRLVGAHRGGMGFPDSNTLERFEWAYRAGAEIIETDLQLSADGVTYLFHDADLARRTRCTERLGDLTSEQLERCHLKGLSHGPPTFEEALVWANGRVILNAEFKAAETVEPAIDLVRAHAAYERVYFQVRHGLSIYERARRHDQRVVLLASPRSRELLLQLLSFDDPRLLVMELHPEIGVTDRETIDAIHQAGKLVSMNAWQFERERTFDWFGLVARRASCTVLYRLGADIAITNVPANCVDQRNAFRPAE